MTTFLQQLTIHRQQIQYAERGASAVEYALLVGLIAVVIITGVTLFGIAVSDLFDISF